jgi:hypothetical protein
MGFTLHTPLTPTGPEPGYGLALLMVRMSMIWGVVSGSWVITALGGEVSAHDSGGRGLASVCAACAGRSKSVRGQNDSECGQNDSERRPTRVSAARADFAVQAGFPGPSGNLPRLR